MKAKVHTIGGLSAHVDQQDLLAWYGNFENRPPVVLVHGEETAMATLAEALKSRYQVPVTMPGPGESLSW